MNQDQSCLYIHDKKQGTIYSTFSYTPPSSSPSSSSLSSTLLTIQLPTPTSSTSSSPSSSSSSSSPSSSSSSLSSSHNLLLLRHHLPRRSLSEFLRQAFLPEGYPSSVSADYARYQLFDSLQAFCSSVSGLLAHRALLQGVGVGDGLATVSSALLHWTIRDGSGMLARILFAWTAGSQLDAYCKSWRFAADILNDLALLLEMLTALFPSPFCFLALICLAAVVRALVAVSGGATRASLTEHQARAHNVADVAAKDGSQETAVALLGMLLGLLLAGLEHSGAIWALFCVATAAHLAANYQAVSAVVMTGFNPQRLEMAVDDWLKKRADNPRTASNNALDPSEIALREPILSSQALLGAFWSGRKVAYGVPFSSLLLSEAQMHALSRERPLYLIAPLRDAPRVKGVALSEDASDAALQLRAYIEAYAGLRPDEADALLSQFSKAGWNISSHKLGISEWRYNFSL